MGEGEVHRGARGRVPRFAFHGSGEDPRRSDSARLPSVTLALAAPDPPVQLRWTTLRVQGPTLRDAALANDGDGSPPVARDPSPPPPKCIKATTRPTLRTSAIEWQQEEQSWPPRGRMWPE